ncbi:uncharacterized protein LY79DRAFT_198586 [Colletotrichum navitas]|uniref:Uncharacterized protein n=1 Tax=Colletotrichum navitas TaxID=681940 RepID=A0AAD8PZT7_9PEZI|nr:uncharacterized protein LY79DRAFT_198586 [Colletotrichum navitas]KAK1590737.1 hypothetical protein LY79DRAFT_198586 [Colletotrichum navitas]
MMIKKKIHNQKTLRMARVPWGHMVNGSELEPRRPMTRQMPKTKKEKRGHGTRLTELNTPRTARIRWSAAVLARCRDERDRWAVIGTGVSATCLSEHMDGSGAPLYPFDFGTGVCFPDGCYTWSFSSSQKRRLMLRIRYECCLVRFRTNNGRVGLCHIALPFYLVPTALKLPAATRNDESRIALGLNPKSY